MDVLFIDAIALWKFSLNRWKRFYMGKVTYYWYRFKCVHKPKSWSASEFTSLVVCMKVHLFARIEHVFITNCSQRIIRPYYWYPINGEADWLRLIQKPENLGANWQAGTIYNIHNSHGWVFVIIYSLHILSRVFACIFCISLTIWTLFQQC